jgi:hypothetical protein
MAGQQALMHSKESSENPRMHRLVRGARRPLVRAQASPTGIISFQLQNKFSSALSGEFQKKGVKLSEIAVPLTRCSDREFIKGKVQESLSELEHVELVLAFADHLGTEGEILNSPRAAMDEAIDANIVSLKLFFDALFSTGKPIRQVCVVTYSGEAMAATYPGFEVAIAGLEVMVKLYAAEQARTHFSMVALHKPWDQRSEEAHLANTILTAVSQPTGALVDEHGRPWQIVHKVGRNALKWSLHA